MRKSIDNSDPYTRLRGGLIVMRGRWVKPNDVVRGKPRTTVSNESKK
jgi:hypothetical protein